MPLFVHTDPRQRDIDRLRRHKIGRQLRYQEPVLQGLVPCVYRGYPFALEVEIRLLDYPQQRPWCRIKVGDNMRLVPNHAHVDEDGVVQLDYLQHWHSHRQPNLLALVQEMVDVFSAATPVTSTQPEAAPARIEAESAAAAANDATASSTHSPSQTTGTSSSTNVESVSEVLKRCRYQHGSRVRSDVSSLCKRRSGKGLRPTSNERSCLVLRGTIGFCFRHTEYRCSVAMELPPDYPQQAPTVWVCAEDGLAITKDHPQVNPQTGLVSVDYLRQWSERSNLIELVSVLGTAFGERPPVYQPQVVVAAASVPPESLPSRPREVHIRTQSESSVSILSSSAGSFITVGEVRDLVKELSGLYSDPDSVRKDASKLLRHKSGRGLEAQIGQWNGSSILLLHGLVAMTFRETEYYVLVDLYVPFGYPDEGPMAFVRVEDESMALVPNHPEVMPNGRVSIDYLTKWRSKYDLRGAVKALSKSFSAHPPVQARVEEEVHDGPAEECGNEAAAVVDEDYREEAQELRDSRRNVELAIQRLLETRESLLDNHVTADRKISAMRAHLRQYGEELSSLPPPTADELFRPASRLEQQLLELVAEDHAIFDALCMMDRGLAKGRLNVESHSHHVRRLGKRQFLVRYHIRKILTKLSNHV